MIRRGCAGGGCDVTTADVEGWTRLSQTRLNELAADYPTLTVNIRSFRRGPWRATRPVIRGVRRRVPACWRRDRALWNCSSTLAPMRPSVCTPRCPASAATAPSLACDQRECVSAHPHTKARLCFQPLAIWSSSTSFRQYLADRRRRGNSAGFASPRTLSSCVIEFHVRAPPLRMSVGNDPAQPSSPLCAVTHRSTRLQENLTNYRLVMRCAARAVQTRLAIQIAAASEFRDGLCFVDLAPIKQSTTAAHA